jgi:hypothetical protein
VCHQDELRERRELKERLGPSSKSESSWVSKVLKGLPTDSAELSLSASGGAVWIMSSSRDSSVMMPSGGGGRAPSNQRCAAVRCGRSLGRVLD